MAEVGTGSSMTSNHEIDVQHMLVHCEAQLKFREHVAFEPLFIVHAIARLMYHMHAVTFHAVDTQMMPYQGRVQC